MVHTVAQGLSSPTSALICKLQQRLHYAANLLLFQTNMKSDYHL